MLRRRAPREFPLSVRATFKRDLQIYTHKFTPLSTDMQKIGLLGCLTRAHGARARIMQPSPLIFLRVCTVFTHSSGLLNAWTKALISSRVT